MKKKFMLLTAITSIFMGLSPKIIKNLHAGEERISKNLSLELYPVKYSKNKSKDCLELGDDCLVPLTKKPLIVLKDFTYEKTTQEVPGVKVHLTQKDDKKLSKITKKYVGNRLALLVNGKVVTAPVLKEPLKGDGFVLTFQNKIGFEKVLNDLE